MHADKANQAVKTARLYETGKYEYDATDQHGPSLYWLTLPSLGLRGVKNLAGSREIDYRIVPALFGVGLIGLLLLLTDGLGRIAVAAAALLAAISPAMVFYSRYYIQETLLVFFTLAALGCGWRYVCTRRLAWALARRHRRGDDVRHEGDLDPFRRRCRGCRGADVGLDAASRRCSPFPDHAAHGARRGPG